MSILSSKYRAVAPSLYALAFTSVMFFTNTFYTSTYLLKAAANGAVKPLHSCIHVGFVDEQQLQNFYMSILGINKQVVWNHQ